MKETFRSLFVGALALAVSVAPVTPIGAQERDRGAQAAVDAVLAAQRTATAESILAAKEQARGEAFDAAMRTGLLSRMQTLSMEQLAGLAQQGADANVPLALGSVTSDLVYTPVTPCRVFDSRVAAGGPGPIPANGQWNVYVAGALNFVAQGGVAAGCGVPVGATSAIINFVTIAPSGAGDIRAWAVANPQPAPPLAAILNYGVVAGLAAIANGVAVPLCDPAAGSCAAGDLRLQADTSATNILGDVVGYFRNPQGLGTVPGATTASVAVYGPALSLPINIGSTFTFVGPTPTIAVPAGGRLYGTAVLAIQSSSAIQWDVCYKLGAAAVVNMSAGNYPNGITSATQVPYATAGIATGLAAGTYTVGFCHRGNSAAASGNYVNGYFVATNP